MKTSQKRASSSASDVKSVVPSGKLPIYHRIDSKHSLRKALVTAHERYGHVSPKKLVYFKKKGRVYLSTIPVRRALDFKVKDCPVCAVMKRNRPKKPASFHVGEKRQWKLWEKVFSDSSGKTRVKTFQGNCYYSVFVCARSERKLFFARNNKSHYPLVYFKFCARAGHYPKLLVTDQAGEILSKAMGSRLAAQGTCIDP